MRLSIQNFFILITLISGTIFYTIFFNYYLEQRQRTATVILESLTDTLSETLYILKKNMETQKSVIESRAILERIAANHEYFAAVSIFNQQELLLTSDPNYRERPSHFINIAETLADPFHILMSQHSLTGELIYYQNSKPVTLQIYGFIDKEEVNALLALNQTKLITYFGVFPTLLFFALILLIKKVIISPLEVVRQFAYYHQNVPDPFPIQEIESIRYSMDQTFTRLEKEQKSIYKLARTDSLSGLANRHALEEHMQRTLAEASRTKHPFAYIFLDLDNFKSINDSLGHDIGDELITSASSILTRYLRTNDFIARVGGDEFVIVIKNYQNLEELITVLDRIQQEIQQPFNIQSHLLHIGCSMGVAFYPEDGSDSITLMKNADIAMYEAKKNGKGRFHFFSKSLNDRVQSDIQLNIEMRTALANNEYKLVYQPKVDLASGLITGAEALIRWHSPSKGLIMPSHFIPAAEENGFIIELGNWVLEEGLAQLTEWQKQGIHIQLSINISTNQLLSPGFNEQLAHLLSQYNVAPSALDIEITEYLFLEQNNRNLNIIDQLHQLGVTISLDDFGTGYSSLSYLKKFHIDVIKIDKSFIDDFSDPDGAIFIETIINMGHTLKKDIIAEGVENIEQWNYLKALGCQTVQGYYFSKPISAGDFAKLYWDNKSAHLA